MKKVWLKDGNHMLSAILYEPGSNRTKTIIVCAHGLFSNKKSMTYREFTEAMKKLGIATLVFDFYGHGESSGKTEGITISIGISNILTALKYVKSLGYRNVGILGSSFGGICSIMAASRTKISFMMLKAPVVFNYKEVISNKRIDVKKWRKDGKILYDNGKFLGYKFYADSTRYNGYTAARKIKIPVIIVHGSRDEIVPIEQSKKVSRIFKNCRLVVLKGATHNFTRPQLKKAISIFSDFTVEVSKRI